MAPHLEGARHPEVEAGVRRPVHPEPGFKGNQGGPHSVEFTAFPINKMVPGSPTLEKDVVQEIVAIRIRGKDEFWGSESQSCFPQRFASKTVRPLSAPAKAA